MSIGTAINADYRKPDVSLETLSSQPSPARRVGRRESAACAPEASPGGRGDEGLQPDEEAQAALAQLRKIVATVSQILPDHGPHDINPEFDQGLAVLVNHLASLIDQHLSYLAEQRALYLDLAQQKAALDQHAIVSMTDVDGNVTYVNSLS